MFSEPYVYIPTKPTLVKHVLQKKNYLLCKLAILIYDFNCQVIITEYDVNCTYTIYHHSTRVHVLLFMKVGT